MITKDDIKCELFDCVYVINTDKPTGNCTAAVSIGFDYKNGVTVTKDGHVNVAFGDWKTVSKDQFEEIIRVRELLMEGK